MSQQQAEATNCRAVTRCAMARVCPRVRTRSKPRGCERVPTLQGRAVVGGAGGCGGCGQGSLVGCWVALCRVECGRVWVMRRCVSFVPAGHVAMDKGAGLGNKSAQRRARS